MIPGAAALLNNISIERPRYSNIYPGMRALYQMICLNCARERSFERQCRVALTDDGGTNS